MSFSCITTNSFRNLADSETVTESKNVFLVGENGQGKTNFLEAVYFCSLGSSFKGSKDSEIVKSGFNSCSVMALFDNSTSRQIAVTIQDSRKNIFLDSKPVSDRKVLLELTPTIVFFHEDMNYISGPPEKQRLFFDQSLSLYDSIYLEDLRRYRKILKTRNSILKEKNTDMLDVIDQQFIDCGIELMAKRADAAKQFSSVFQPLYQEISNIDDVSIKYSPSWKTAEKTKLLDMLITKREMELSFGISLYGPHRDRYQYIKNGKDFSSTASTGQRRLLALLLRISQAIRFKQMTQKLPILLLDDVLLELDPAKKIKFIKMLPDYEQAFFTFLPGDQISLFRDNDSVSYTVSGGVLTK